MGAGSRPGRRPEAHHRVLPPNPLNPALTVILPCRNEAVNIARYPAELFPALDALRVSYEVVIVDDGSTDDTAAVARRLQSARNDTAVLSLASQRGMGAALRAGFAAANGAFIATLDADLTFPPAALQDLYSAAATGKADLASGSPYLRPGDMDGVPWTRRLPSLMINALYRGLFGRALSAYTPVLRLYRASLIKRLPLVSNGFEINAEIAARAALAGCRIVEVPAPLRARAAGVSKLRRWRELKCHLALIARLLSGR